jgi:hypothetical protein
MGRYARREPGGVPVGVGVPAGVVVREGPPVAVAVRVRAVGEAEGVAVGDMVAEAVGVPGCHHVGAGLPVDVGVLVTVAVRVRVAVRVGVAVLKPPV